jgi:hypothetical protein
MMEPISAFHEAKGKNSWTSFQSSNGSSGRPSRPSRSIRSKKRPTTHNPFPVADPERIFVAQLNNGLIANKVDS